MYYDADDEDVNDYGSPLASSRKKFVGDKGDKRKSDKEESEKNKSG